MFQLKRSHHNSSQETLNSMQTAMQTTPVSAVIITLNAASQLEKTLQSLQFCDDLVIVDSGSTDQTLQIAASHGARVFQLEWRGFGPQKQYAVAQAKNDWVLCLDADEEVSPELRQSIQRTLQNAPSEMAGYRMPRCNYFLGRYLRHGEGYPDLSLRLFHRHRANWNTEPVHEGVEGLTPGAQFGLLDGDLLHHSAESLNQYLNKQNRYTEIQASMQAARGKWPSTGKLVLSPLVRFIKFYVLRRGFLDGWAGLVHISIGCFNSFIKYAKTREKILAQNHPRNGP